MTTSHTGDPAYCSECLCPIVVYESTESGYQLVCGCQGYSIDLNDLARNESLFTPITGRWSTIDDVDPWEDAAFDS